MRRRTGGDDAGWHLKLPVDADTRREIQRPLGTDDTVPAELRALVRVHTRDAPLEPMATITTRRRRWHISDDAGAEVAEFADDRVHATTSSSPGDHDWRELEIELSEDAPPTLLDTLEDDLRAAGVRRSDAPSKLSRTLGERLRRPVDGRKKLRKAGSDVVVQEYLRAQTGTLRTFDPLVRLDAGDAVHRMRVTARRLRAALQGFRRVLDRDATAHLVEDLRWLGGELAPARDAEVTGARFTAAVDALPDGHVLGPVAAQVTRRFAREQREGQKRAIAALDSSRYPDLQQRLDDLLDDPPTTGRAKRRELARAVHKAHRRTSHRMRAALAEPWGGDRDIALHEARKAAKRLRYVLEAVEPARGKKARKARKKTKKLASTLGDHHDTVTARPVLRELAAQAHQEGGNGFTFGLLHAREQAAAGRLDDAAEAAWSRVATTPRT